jgi:hypothetical protein
MYNGGREVIDDFSGGYCGNLSLTSLANNQAADCRDIVVKPNGKGFRSRWGWKQLNTVAIGSGSHVPQGVGFDAAGVRVIRNAKLYIGVRTSGSGLQYGFGVGLTFTDITGAYAGFSSAVTAWNYVSFNSVLYAFGGNISGTYETPIKDNGALPAAMGTLPSFGGSEGFYGGFTANNRMFGYGAGKLWWSIIGNAENWTGTGSGNLTIGTLGDDIQGALTAHAVLPNNLVLIFRENGIHRVDITSAPFSQTRAFTGVGAWSKSSVVVIDDVAYFITKKKRMKATDGYKIFDFPSSADNLWDALSASNSEIVGWREVGPDYDWICWSFYSDYTGGSTIRTIIVWDRLNKCWLRQRSDVGGNFGAWNAPDGYAYGMDLFGWMYNPQYYTAVLDSNYSTSYTPKATDDLASLSYGINWGWRSGFISGGDLSTPSLVDKIGVAYATKSSGNPVISYGFDFAAGESNVQSNAATVKLANSVDFSQAPASTETRGYEELKVYGRGSSFQWQIGNSSLYSVDSEIDSITLLGKIQGHKDRTVR